MKRETPRSLNASATAYIRKRPINVVAVEVAAIPTRETRHTRWLTAHGHAVVKISPAGRIRNRLNTR